MANGRFFAGTVLGGSFINLRPLLRPLKPALEKPSPIYIFIAETPPPLFYSYSMKSPTVTTEWNTGETGDIYPDIQGR